MSLSVIFSGSSKNSLPLSTPHPADNRVTEINIMCLRHKLHDLNLLSNITPHQYIIFSSTRSQKTRTYNAHRSDIGHVRARSNVADIQTCRDHVDSAPSDFSPQNKKTCSHSIDM